MTETRSFRLFLLLLHTSAGVNIKQNIQGYSVSNRRSNLKTILKLKIQTFMVLQEMLVKFEEILRKRIERIKKYSLARISWLKNEIVH